MSARSVVVLGAGTGGLVAARELRRRLDPADRVVIVDRDQHYRYAPSFLWVLAGTRRPEQLSRDRARLRRSGIEVYTAEAHDVDLTRGRVVTSQGPVDYDRLVIALGADLDPGALPGFAEVAHNVYSLDGALSAAQALRRLDRGRVAVVVSGLPYKCPAAPYETAFLTEALLRHRGVRDRTEVDIFTPEPLPMPTAGPALGQALADMLARRGIGFHPNTVVQGIDADARELVLAERPPVPYDVVLGVPVHRAPRLLQTSGLVRDSGFLPVDPATLATAEEGVFGLGDVTAIPIAGGKLLPKAGVFAESEAKVVARTIAGELTGRPIGAAFDGRGACFVELGDGRAAFAAGDFYAAGGPEIRLRRPGRHWHLAKVAFEQYWLRRWC